MSAEIKVPQLGESIVEATVGQWLKGEGDAVAAGEPLVELETDKVNMEVAAPEAGVLQRIAKQAGETVGIGEVLGVVGAGDGAGPQPAAAPAQAQAQAAAPPDAGATPDLTPPPGTAATPPEPGGPAAASQPAQQAPAQQASAPAAPAAAEQEGADGDEHARATPLARRIAAEHGIDIDGVAGTGPGGRVTKDDVAAYVEAQRARQGGQQPAAPAQPAPAPPQPLPAQAPAASAPAAPSAPPAPPTITPPAATSAAVARGPEERVRMSRRRQTIARRLVEAQQTAAMLTTFNEVDMSAVMGVRKRRRDAFKERHGIGLGFMSFFTKAAIGALKAFPRLNAEIQGDEIVLKRYYDIGIAVGAEEGLVVPVVRDADRLSFAEIERQIAELAEKARGNKLSLAELPRTATAKSERT